LYILGVSWWRTPFFHPNSRNAAEKTHALLLCLRVAQFQETLIWAMAIGCVWKNGSAWRENDLFDLWISGVSYFHHMKCLASFPLHYRCWSCRCKRDISLFKISIRWWKTITWSDLITSQIIIASGKNSLI
jgi:hypothetical protein